MKNFTLVLPTGRIATRPSTSAVLPSARGMIIWAICFHDPLGLNSALNTRVCNLMRPMIILVNGKVLDRTNYLRRSAFAGSKPTAIALRRSDGNERAEARADRSDGMKGDRSDISLPIVLASSRHHVLMC